MVVTPSGLSQPGFASGGWCAYHWAIPAGGRFPRPGSLSAICFHARRWRPVRELGQQWPAGAFDGFSIIGGHEYAEAITDPIPVPAGWTGVELGADKCAWQNVGNRPFGDRQLAVQPLGARVVAASAPAAGQSIPEPGRGE